MTLVHIDGGCRGNPGPGAYGVFILHDGVPIELKRAIPGPISNNVAEYCGLIAALRWAKHRSMTALTVRSDSQVLIYHMLGRYQLHAKNLIPLYLEATTLTTFIQDRGVAVTFEYVPRERNREADRLCNEAMDAAGFPRKATPTQVRA